MALSGVRVRRWEAVGVNPSILRGEGEGSIIVHPVAGVYETKLGQECLGFIM